MSDVPATLSVEDDDTDNQVQQTNAEDLNSRDHEGLFEEMLVRIDGTWTEPGPQGN